MRRFDHVSLIYGRTGQVVSFYPPDAVVTAEGAPTIAATYSVWRGIQGNNETALLAGSATLDTVSTTLTASAGYSQTNRRALTLSSTSNTGVGERYCIGSADTVARREIVTLAQISSSTAAVAEEELSFDYASGSTFKGLRHYFTIDSTFIQTESNINVWGSQSGGILDPMVFGANYPNTAAPSYRVRWVYATGSTTRETWTTFDVCRKPAQANLSITDLRSVAPDLPYLEPAAQFGQNWAPQLVRAEMDVALDIRGDGYDPNAINDPEFYDRLVLWKWAVNVGYALWIGGTKPAWFDSVREEYTNLRAKFVTATLKAKVDLGTTGATTVNPVAQLWLR